MIYSHETISQYNIQKLSMKLKIKLSTKRKQIISRYLYKLSVKQNIIKKHYHQSSTSFYSNLRIHNNKNTLVHITKTVCMKCITSFKISINPKNYNSQKHNPYNQNKPDRKHKTDIYNKIPISYFKIWILMPLMLK